MFSTPAAFCTHAMALPSGDATRSSGNGALRTCSIVNGGAAAKTRRATRAARNKYPNRTMMNRFQCSAPLRLLGPVKKPHRLKPVPQRRQELHLVTAEIFVAQILQPA